MAKKPRMKHKQKHEPKQIPNQSYNFSEGRKKKELAQVIFELIILSLYTQSKDREQCKHVLNSLDFFS